VTSIAEENWRCLFTRHYMVLVNRWLRWFCLSRGPRVCLLNSIFTNKMRNMWQVFHISNAIVHHHDIYTRWGVHFNMLGLYCQWCNYPLIALAPLAISRQRSFPLGCGDAHYFCEKFRKRQLYRRLRNMTLNADRIRLDWQITIASHLRVIIWGIRTCPPHVSLLRPVSWIGPMWCLQQSVTWSDH